MTPANGELLRRGDDPDSTHGGHAFLEDLKRYCYNADTKELTFKADVHYYTMCEKQYVCEQ